MRSATCWAVRHHLLDLAPGRREQLVALTVGLRHLGPRSLRRGEALLDPPGPLVQHRGDRPVEEVREQSDEDDEVDRVPEKVPAVDS